MDGRYGYRYGLVQALLQDPAHHARQELPLLSKTVGQCRLLQPHRCDCQRCANVMHHVGSMTRQVWWLRIVEAVLVDDDASSEYGTRSALTHGTIVGDNDTKSWSGDNAHCPYAIRMTV